MSKLYTISKTFELPNYFGTGLFECREDCPLAFTDTILIEYFGCVCPFQETWNICPFKGEGGWNNKIEEINNNEIN